MEILITALIVLVVISLSVFFAKMAHDSVKDGSKLMLYILCVLLGSEVAISLLDLASWIVDRVTN